MTRLSEDGEICEVVKYLYSVTEPKIEVLAEKVNNGKILLEIKNLAESFKGLNEISYELNVVIYFKCYDCDEIFNLAPILTSYKIGIIKIKLH